ncbi:DUF547 domain-containing protein [uncultured Erythrobacter sp.]|uniref:DUF547 domain-containing protein n=1 Tax=uncultured Erythrobacter sp. TaxID=263913 RepID=UPI00262605F9|nr:DUF547 domain-containing protein [uncultured Erythrobacter sp.]
MTLRLIAAFAATTALGTGLAAPLAAESAAISIERQASSPSASTNSQNPLARFTPAADRREHRIDYAHWDEALGWFVVPMGPSIRVGAGRVDPRTGTRRIYGHESRYRLEGNRVAFSYLTAEIRASLTEYRADLERIGSEIDLTTLPRNEQLAFWLNLHNVAVIEALAGEYPMAEPYERTFGSNSAALDDAKLVTVARVSLSPREIREGIVYPNWSDPKVIYGFWRGVIGGPSIQRLAFTGGNVDALLSLSAEEFVNSLRGVESWGGSLRVSPIYEDTASFYFSDSEDLRAHLSQYARDDVRELVSRYEQVSYKSFETDIADLQRGERDPSLAQLCSSGGGPVGGYDLAISAQPIVCNTPASRPNPAIQRLMEERAENLRRARSRGIRSGMVIYGDGAYVAGETVEVE